MAYAPSPAYFAHSSTLKPGTIPYPKANLIVSGTPIDVKVVRTVEKDSVMVKLISNGESVETENYTSDESSFKLVSAAGETYDPPLPLVQFPFHLGKTWEWSGHMVCGEARRSASAFISTVPDKINLPNANYNDAVKVNVNLTILTVSGGQANRMLDFWFVKDVGMVKRDFNACSTRLPGN